MRNHAPNMVENLVRDPFFIVCLSQGLPKHIESKVLFTFTLYKVYLKKRSGTSLPVSFSARFLKKSHYILLTDHYIL